ncbi:hypothetical protein [Streptomyces sp. NPDC008150]|uniref:hypothetical protein n=1 Tax=Streptomyces sp. NPDC008150 TaxID=3364816 RepID=UPI0036F05AD3
MGEGLRQASFGVKRLRSWWSERLGREIVYTWAAGMMLSVPVWILLEAFRSPDAVIGDGGLAAFGLLIILGVTTLFAWTGVVIIRDVITESRAGTGNARRRLLTMWVLAAGTAGWIALWAILALGRHPSPTVGLVAVIPLATTYALAFLGLVRRKDVRWHRVGVLSLAPIALVVLLRFV